MGQGRNGHFNHNEKGIYLHGMNYELARGHVTYQRSPPGKSFNFLRPKASANSIINSAPAVNQKHNGDIGGYVAVETKYLKRRNKMNYIAAALMVAGFTVWGNGSETLITTFLICFVKIAMIFAGGCLLIKHMEKESE